MKPSRHFASSAVFSLLLAPWLVWRSLIVFAGGVLVDLDRYLWFAFRYRKPRLGEALERFKGRDRIREDVRFFHSVEFLAFLLLAGFISTVFLFFALGVVFHLLLDMFIQKKHGRLVIRFDPSRLHCLALEMFRKEGRSANEKQVEIERER